MAWPTSGIVFVSLSLLVLILVYGTSALLNHLRNRRHAQVSLARANAAIESRLRAEADRHVRQAAEDRRGAVRPAIRGSVAPQTKLSFAASRNAAPNPPAPSANETRAAESAMMNHSLADIGLPGAASSRASISVCSSDNYTSSSESYSSSDSCSSGGGGSD